MQILLKTFFESLSPLLDTHPTARPIDDYLDHLCAPLVGKMTYDRRVAVREEVRTHLLVLAAAHEELGGSSAEALQAAMEQFGDARKLGRSLAREYAVPFTPSGPLLWYLLHAAIGGFVGSVAFITMDLMLQHKHLVHYTEVPVDFLVGFAMGWIPAVQLLKRPASPLLAAVRMGVCYTALMTGLILVIGSLSGIKGPKHVEFLLTAIVSMGVQGAIGGAVMSLLFRRLERFGPRTGKSQIAR